MNDLLQQLAQVLQARQWRMTCAESCTGGWIAKLCTDLPGSSTWFDCGFVTYSNEAKQKVLGVATETLKQWGAVSEAVVAEMALGALQQVDAQVAVAVSGIAGPSGATADKPIGLVCLAWLLKGETVETEHYCFTGDRETIREQAVRYALQGLLQRLR